MSRIVWGENRHFEHGVDRVVLYLPAGPMAWNGVSKIDENPSDTTVSSYFFDGHKTLDAAGEGDYSIHLAAYYCPEDIEDLTEPFGLTYRVQNGTKYKVHLLYGCRAIATAQAWASSTEQVNLSDFEWDISTTPVPSVGYKGIPHLVIDSEESNLENLQAVEDLLYGVDSGDDAILPDPGVIIDIFQSNAVMTIVDHGDGTWTATGPEDMVHMTGPTSFEIISPTVSYLDEVTYRVTSY